MDPTGQSWAIVLAAGDGTRLSELTTHGGVAIPKQFCSLRGGRSLVGDALARAARIVPRKRIVVVVAREHRRLWGSEFAALPRENVIVQPGNRGTAAGVLLPALAVLERDPLAKLAFLPSDHFVKKEYVLEAALRLALASLDEAGDALTLLGVMPDVPETGYGWIVPAPSDRLLPPVERFVEKPEAAIAAELFARGALWNSFLFAVNAPALLRLYEERLPDMVIDFRRVFTNDGAEREARLEELYARLAPRDFSRDVLEENERRLRLAIVPPCGWTDLGTPGRVEACLSALQAEPEHEDRRDAHFPYSGAILDLARAVRNLVAQRQAASVGV